LLTVRQPAACRRRSGGGSPATCANLGAVYTTREPVLSRRFRGTATAPSPPTDEESRFTQAHGHLVERGHVLLLLGAEGLQHRQGLAVEQSALGHLGVELRLQVLQRQGIVNDRQIAGAGTGAARARVR